MPTGQRPLLVDFFCKAGGASMGYYQAGFDVIGVDLEPQPHYPFEFHQGDFREVGARLLAERPVVAIGSSPPCKLATDLKSFSAKHHTDLIPAAREFARATGLPYVIENVEGAHLEDPIVLCGSMFDRLLLRHREFETNFPLMQMPHRHAEQERMSPGFPVLRYHSGKPRVVMSPVVGVYGKGQGLGVGEVARWREFMEIDWMVRDELSQAIPPYYTRWIGARLMNVVAASV
jgi:DNA (cytosine-5)-methyltransferase 1